MNWQPTARKDFRDGIRSRTVLLLLVVFSGLFVIANGLLGSGSDPFDEFVSGTFGNVTTVLPVIAIVLGYKAVLHERTSGSLVLALSLPQSRTDFVVGKLVGRSLVLAVPVAASLLVAGAIATLRYDSASLAPYLAFIVLTVLYGVTFVSISLAWSMSTTAGRRVLVGVIGAYVVLDQFWAQLVTEFVLLLYRFDFSVVSDLPDWAVVLQLAAPGEAYRHVVSALFGFDGSTAHLAAETPWIVNPWTAALVLVGWTVAPIAIGYSRFGSTDL